MSSGICSCSSEDQRTELHKAASRFRGMLAVKSLSITCAASPCARQGQGCFSFDELLGANRSLLKHICSNPLTAWSYKSKTCARRFFDGWVDQLKWSRLKPYHKFARMVEKHFDGILTAFCDKKVSLGYIESANLKAKNVIHRLTGYRDKDYILAQVISLYPLDGSLPALGGNLSIAMS